MVGILGDVMARASANKATTCAASLGVLFVAWCLYFDRKRRTNPNFKKRLRDRRLNLRKCPKKGPIRLPDLTDNDAVVQFLVQEIRVGENLLGKGDEAGGVEHMAYAVAVCGQPNKLLEVYQKTLVPHVFQRLLNRLPSLSEEIAENPTGVVRRQS